MSRIREALTTFVDTINATGGVVEHEDGSIAPAADQGWTDLGDAYIQACEALDVAPKIEESGLASAEDAEYTW